MIIGKRNFDINNGYYIMGILNLTPDSFADGGQYTQLDKALLHVEQMIREGADIIDIGAQSTRPGYTEVGALEEIQRLAPIIEAIKERFDIVLSLDTYQGEVVKEFHSSIDMVNDVTGLTFDTNMADYIAKYDLSACIMANKNHTIHMVENKNQCYLEAIKSELKAGIKIALKAGIPKDKIMIDGGVGFGKDYEKNLITINRTKEFTDLSYPVLMATSNKGFMGRITGTKVGTRRDETVATTIIGAMNGARFFRVHDVSANKKALQIYEAIRNEQMPSDI